jgi:hypothetical protein
LPSTFYETLSLQSIGTVKLIPCHILFSIFPPREPTGRADGGARVRSLHRLRSGPRDSLQVRLFLPIYLHAWKFESLALLISSCIRLFFIVLFCSTPCKRNFRKEIGVYLIVFLQSCISFVVNEAHMYLHFAKRA